MPATPHSMTPRPKGHELPHRRARREARGDRLALLRCRPSVCASRRVGFGAVDGSSRLRVHGQGIGVTQLQSSASHHPCVCVCGVGGRVAIRGLSGLRAECLAVDREAWQRGETRSGQKTNNTMRLVRSVTPCGDLTRVARVWATFVDFESVGLATRGEVVARGSEFFTMAAEALIRASLRPPDDAAAPRRRRPCQRPRPPAADA